MLYYFNAVLKLKLHQLNSRITGNVWGYLAGIRKKPIIVLVTDCTKNIIHIEPLLNAEHIIRPDHRHASLSL